MRKKVAEELHDICTADQFLSLQSLYLLNLTFQAFDQSSVSVQAGLSEMRGNPEDRFSHDMAHLIFIETGLS